MSHNRPHWVAHLEHDTSPRIILRPSEEEGLWKSEACLDATHPCGVHPLTGCLEVQRFEVAEEAKGDSHGAVRSKESLEDASCRDD